MSHFGYVSDIKTEFDELFNIVEALFFFEQALQNFIISRELSDYIQTALLLLLQSLVIVLVLACQVAEFLVCASDDDLAALKAGGCVRNFHSISFDSKLS